MTDAEIADVLDRAADELLTRGWTQGTPHRPDGTVCVVGAMSAARCGNPTGRFDSDAYQAMARYLDQYPVSGWNDAEGRTEDEVHDALRGCAKQLREKAGQP